MQMAIRGRRTLMLFCCPLLAAQQASGPAGEAPPPEVVFSVTTSLVQVDAVVTDSKGRYITDLNADDFEVYEDGKPQAITNLSYVRTGSKPEPRPRGGRTKSAAASPPPPSAPMRRRDVRRTIVLMVDDLGLSFESMASVREALRKFVEKQMQPGDLVAICRTGSGSGALEQFTNDKRILLAAANSLRWDVRNMRTGVFESYGKYSQLAGQLSGGGLTGLAGQGVYPAPNVPNAPAGSGAGPGASLGQANTSLQSLDSVYGAEYNESLTFGALGAVNYVVTAMREMPGRKSVVLFSDGMSLAYSPELRDAMRRLVDRANRAGTVIYTMLATGLQTLALDAQDRVDLTQTDMPGTVNTTPQGTLNGLTQVGAPGGRDAEYNAGRQGLAEIAKETGGVGYEPGNDLNWGLDRMLEDQEGYYLIGYKPPAGTFEQKHGSLDYHRITVRVKRAGLHVRSRTGFFGATDEETLPKYSTPLDQLHAAMLSPFQSSAVRLRLTALYAEVPRQGPVVRNLLHIDTRDLTFQSVHDSVAARRHRAFEMVAHAEILAVATGADEQAVATLVRDYELRATEKSLGQGLQEGALYTIDVPVKKRGAHQIHVAVRDAASGKVGSASQFLEIPNPKKDRLALTSVVLQQGNRQPEAPAYAGMTPATRQFRAGGQVEYFCMVAKGKKGAPAEDLEARIRIVRDGREVYSGPSKLIPVQGGLAFMGNVRLSDTMAPGDYYLGVVASESGARKKVLAVQWTDFQILP